MTRHPIATKRFKPVNLQTSSRTSCRATTMYRVKEIVHTLQGEGAQAGRAAVFCRFSGCNLWSGLEPDRSDATCQFCDTDFVGTDGPGGGVFDSAESLAAAVAARWRGLGPARPLVVLTGGEPLLQLDPPAIASLHDRGFEVAVETNGTIPAPPGIDWLCVSPKAGTVLRQSSGNELKVIVPQEGLDLTSLEALAFDHFFLQAMDGPRAAENVRLAVHTCLERPRWRLSLQAHKLLGLP